ncbi:MAG: NADH-ubiquinone oxidoreductase subunit E family protein [Campylobacteraceae bacterium]|jgi:NADH-quinone oxidoreductase subunit F|nr:NADH-ubiquinone oxidoreductase subunit E family protein [Campylobacteraceae bacterium]
MKRYDLRHLSDRFAPRIFELANSSQKDEVSIFVFETTEDEKLKTIIKNLNRKGHEVMNSLRFNEADWMIVVKAFVNESKISNPLFYAFEKYGVELKTLDRQSAVLCIGTYFAKDNEILAHELYEWEKKLIYMSAQEDLNLKRTALKHIKYEVGSEGGVLALIAKVFLKDVQIPQDVKDYLDKLDDGYLSAESNVGEEEMEEIKEAMSDGTMSFLFGRDLYHHPDADLIAALTALISRFIPLKVSVLDEIELKVKPKMLLPPPINELKSFDGTIVYFYDSDEASPKLYGSSQFAIAAKLKDGDEVSIETSNSVYKSLFFIDTNMKGMVAILGINKNGYRYEAVKVSKRGSNG